PRRPCPGPSLRARLHSERPRYFTTTRHYHRLVGASRGRGIPVDPDRVRQARLESGFSLADLAGEEVSRAFIHQVEQGRSKPSREVLELIAARTGKPISYFTRSARPTPAVVEELETSLADAARLLRKTILSTELTEPEVEALELLDATVRRGIRLVRAIAY